MTALLTPTIAILGSVIAVLQWRINRLRLKHELFDKRYEIFTAAMAFVVSIVQNGKAIEVERIKFLQRTKGAKFLFPEKIDKYLEDIHRKACDLQCLDAELEGVGVGKERSENVMKQSAIKKWFNVQLNALAQQFQSFIKLEH